MGEGGKESQISRTTCFSNAKALPCHSQILSLAWESPALPNKPDDSDSEGSSGVGTTFRKSAVSLVTREPNPRGGGATASVASPPLLPSCLLRLA